MAKPKTVIDSAEIQKVIGEIVTRFHPKKIILFGSYAYGQPHEWSDLDLLVVASRIPPRKERWKVAHELEEFVSSPLQLIFMSPEEFAETRDVVGGIAFPAHHWGRVVYESHPGGRISGDSIRQLRDRIWLRGSNLETPDCLSRISVFLGNSRVPFFLRAPFSVPPL